MLYRVLKHLLRGKPGVSPGHATGGKDRAQSSPRNLLDAAVRLHSAGDVPGARRLYQQVLETQPENADAHHMLGLLELYCADHAAAGAALRRALDLDPGNAAIHGHLGLVLEYQGKLAESLACHARAAALNPQDPEAHNLLGNALVVARRLEEAVASYHRAMALDPATPSYRFNLSLVQLLQGNYAEGWENYEYRWDGSAELAGRRRTFSQPQWRGEALAGRTLLLHAEQAFGDTLQFARYVAPVAQRNDDGRVVLECQPELKRLLASIPGRVELVAQGEPLPAFDCHCPLLSLPLALPTTAESIPGVPPYLSADPVDVERWRHRLPGGNALKVGLVWSGKARRLNHWHNLDLADLAPLFDVPGASFFSLQKTQTGYAVSSDCTDTPVADFTGELNDFADTAALVCNLELVISVDTAVAHLCGALGKPVWLLARYDSDWRWLLERTDSPWYPSMRIFRQRSHGSWNDLVPLVATALRGEVERGG